MNVYIKLIFAIFISVIYATVYANSNIYPWLGRYNERHAIGSQIAVPAGYQRMNVQKGSFPYWLRHMPLKEGQTAVYLYNGEKKENQEAHAAVIDIDTGNTDLQQCADAVIRLKAEYLYLKRDYKSIHFNFTNGENLLFETWIAGYRPVVTGSKIKWQKQEEPDSTYSNFKKYLKAVFTYAGTFSLNQELQAVGINEMEIGDVFIQAGFPGHAVIVVDMAVHQKTGDKIFLLAQSYMPAQDIHVLKNPSNESLSPWYELMFEKELKTPEWTFQKEHLKRFRN
ncbi:MAG: DUF4846 domain-containing protein [bacterium]